MPFCTAKVFEWAERDEEFVKRAAFAMIAYQSVHAKKRDDADFLIYLPLIQKHSDDPRNFVRKAVNWALRQIGKRSAFLYPHALELAETLAASADKTASWIGKDAVRELDGDKVRARLGLGK
jgi:3-methyladenine DNA glycosylase AlkD